MKARIQWAGEAMFLGESGSGHVVVMDGPPLDDRVVITTDEPELNPRFVALLVEGVRQIPSPYWMQYRLRLAGQRPINVVVDISNYVMLEVGQPNHTFDYDVLRRRADSYAPDGPIQIHTRLPRPGGSPRAGRGRPPARCARPGSPETGRRGAVARPPPRRTRLVRG